MRLAARRDRLAGQVLDGLVAGIPIFSGLMAGLFFGGIGVVLLPLGVCAGAAYYLFCDCMEGGQSLGKRARGIAVVDRRTGRPCSPAQSFVRNVSLSIFGLFDIVLIFGRTRRRIGDWISGTLVVVASPELERAAGSVPRLDARPSICPACRSTVAAVQVPYHGQVVWCERCLIPVPKDRRIHVDLLDGS